MASRLWWPGETIAKVVGRGDSEADVWPVVRADGSVSGAIGWLWAADGAARQDAQDAAIDRLLAQVSRA